MVHLQITVGRLCKQLCKCTKVPSYKKQSKGNLFFFLAFFPVSRCLQIKRLREYYINTAQVLQSKAIQLALQSIDSSYLKQNCFLSFCCVADAVLKFICMLPNELYLLYNSYRIYQDSVRILHNFHRNTEKHVELLNSIQNISQEQKKKKYAILVQTTQLPQATLKITQLHHVGGGGAKRHTVRLTAVQYSNNSMQQDKATHSQVLLQ